VRLAAVVVCRDQGRVLGGTLQALAGGPEPPAETVVVDDGSTDLYTREVLATSTAPGVTVVRAARRGLGAAVNAGIAATSAPCVLVLEANDPPAPSWLAEALAALDADSGLAAVGHGPPSRPGVATLLARGSQLRTVLLRRAVWERLEGLDEERGLGSCALADFAIRALEAGGRVVLAGPRHAGGHPGPTDLVDVQRRLRARHPASVEALGVELVLAHEAWLLDLRDRRRTIEQAQVAHERALADAQAAVANLARALEGAGRARIEWGDLRRLGPHSPAWGLERGLPIDRHFVERFLDRHRADIRGRVLEMKDAGYTERFGGSAVTERAVLDIDRDNPRATLVADLARADAIPTDTFDCFILTQTLHVIHDVRGALHHAHRILAPGGVLLCTLPAVARISLEDGGLDGGDHWRFTEASVRRLFAERFDPATFSVEVTGNVLVATAFLHGLAAHELSPAELEHIDPWHPLLFCVRAVKAPRRAPAVARSTHAGAILLYHRVARVEQDAAGLAITPAAFRAHMEHVRRAWRPMTLAALAAAAAAGDVPDRAVAVTIDDGYLDALSTASPILTDLDIPATFFLTSGTLEHDQEFWWDTLEAILLGPDALPAVLDIALDGSVERLPTATRTDRAEAWRRVNDWMVGAGADAREERLRSLARWSGHRVRPRESHRALRAAEARELAGRAGHTIGAHGARHLLLTALPLAEVLQEVLDGKAWLETVLARPVTAFAYPYGACDANAREVVRAGRFTVAVTGGERPVRSVEDALRLPRLDLSGLDASAFAARLHGTAGLHSSR
jgi:peptidoglycan/xylan/chitin deacetylase (PgdA/CDA1 family)